MSRTIGMALVGETVMLAQVNTPDWLQSVRELGSFGLVAFVVWWYATRVAPKQQAEFLAHNLAQREDAINSIKALTASYIAAIDHSREDYLEAAKRQREDYLSARSEDRAQLNNLSVGVSALTLAMERRAQREQEITDPRK